jgi:hypothetical protein
MRVVRSALAALAVALAVPAVAEAHTVTPDVDCSGATMVYESTAGTTLEYTVAVNGATAVQDSFLVPDDAITGTLKVPYTVPTGTFTVTVSAVFSTGENGTITKTLTCITAPSPPAPAPAPPPPAAAAAPVSAPAPAPPSTNAVAGVQERSPASIARLRARSVCTSRVVRVTVVGRFMRDVALSVNGRHVRTVTVRSGRRSLKASLPMRNRHRASQVVTARVRFRNGAAPRTVSARASRCSQVAVRPTFTG